MKVLIYSHESDIDGIGAIILAKIAFENMDYFLSPSFTKLEELFRGHLNSGMLDKYDKIFITDLALENPSLSLVATNNNIASKILIFDHHKASIDNGLDVYDFTKISETNNGIKTCGTELFYQYLIEKNLIERSPILDEFVELTRLEDTWDWKKAGEYGQKAHDLAILFNQIGIDEYIERLLKKLKSKKEKLDFDDDEERIIKEKKREYLETMQKIWSETEFFIDEFGNPYGIVFANYEYRNEVAEYIRTLKDAKGIKYIVIVALNKGLYGQKSYRSIESGFDVNQIAVLHGGGGHPAASSVEITKEQKEYALSLTRKNALKYLADSKYC